MQARSARTGIQALSLWRKQPTSMETRVQSSRHVPASGERFAIVLPYLWLAAFFLAPFVIILKISLSQTELAQPPYSPVLDLAAGCEGLKEFFAALTVQNYFLLASD